MLPLGLGPHGLYTFQRHLHRPVCVEELSADYVPEVQVLTTHGTLAVPVDAETLIVPVEPASRLPVWPHALALIFCFKSSFN